MREIQLKIGGRGVTGWYMPLPWSLRILERHVIKALVTAQDIPICGGPAFIAGNGESDRHILVRVVEFRKLSPVVAHLPGNPVGLIDQLFAVHAQGETCDKRGSFDWHL